MATHIILPKQGLQMTEGTITKWLAAEGDSITQGQPLFEMETDKLTITIDAPVSGTLLRIVRGELETVPVAETVAVVGQPGEDPGGAPVPAPPTPLPQAADPRVFATPRAKTAAAERNVDCIALRGSGPQGLVIERDVLAAAREKALKASPAARREAELAGISLEGIKGGEDGRIMKGDALSQAARRGPDARETPEEPTAMRRAIWQSMHASLRDMAQAHHTIDVDMTEAAALRRASQEASRPVSYNDILVMAVCRALMEYPQINSTVADGKILRRRYVNMGLAVALDQGLIVPTIRDAHAMTLRQIHEASAALVEKARKGTLTPEEYGGGTFTITNLGMYGIVEFTAIINPPQAAILAVGKIEDRPVAREGAVVVRAMMRMTLTYDHRIVDGAPAARFLHHVMTLLQSPALML